MIEEIVLNCGPTEASAPLRLAGTPGVTILVGPNNCGKSALLEAIYNKLAVQNDAARPSTLATIKFPEMTEVTMEEHPSFTDVWPKTRLQYRLIQLHQKATGSAKFDPILMVIGRRHSEGGLLFG